MSLILSRRAATPEGNFFDRISQQGETLNAIHINAYEALISGLVAAGIWSDLDFFYVFATSTATIAALNLVSPLFTVSPIGSPIFSPDNGFTGSDTSPAVVWLDTNYNPLVDSVRLTVIDAHASCFVMSNQPATGGPAMGSYDSSGPWLMQINPLFNADGNAYYALWGGVQVSAPAGGITAGHHLITRGASSQAVYRNGNFLDSNLVGASTPPNDNIFILARNDVGGGGPGGPWQISQASMGALISAVSAASLNSLIRDYLITVRGSAP